jgi:hypothetical protein
MIVLMSALFRKVYPRFAGGSILDVPVVFSYRSPGKRMKQVTIRLELRVAEEMNEYLQVEAQSRKLSFEGLILMYIDERMKKDRRERQHSDP